MNPGLWGKRLAEYLQRSLAEQGLATGEILPEDWGWVVNLEHDAFRSWIGCGHQNGEPDEFLCFIQPDRPSLRRWLRRVDTTEHVARVAEALEQALRQDPDLRNLRWLEPDER